MGKSIYFWQLVGFLEEEGYKVVYINLESLWNVFLFIFFEIFVSDLDWQWGMILLQIDIVGFFYVIEQFKEEKFVLIIDEVEGVNEVFFGDFLYLIWCVYYFCYVYGLKSVILVGVINILGVVSDNVFLFNIVDNLDIFYFLDEEV